MNAPNEVARLQAAADRARRGYRHEEAVGWYSQALDHYQSAGLDDAELEYDLRDGRASSNTMLANMSAALADYQAMIQLAQGDPPRLINALIAPVGLYGELGDLESGLIDLDEALKLARQSQNRPLEVDALIKLVMWNTGRGSTDQARHYLEELLPLSQSLDDNRLQTLARRAELFVRSAIDNRPYLEEEKELLVQFRIMGDRYWEARTLHSLGARATDVGLKRDYSHQALALYRRGAGNDCFRPRYPGRNDAHLGGAEHWIPATGYIASHAVDGYMFVPQDDARPDFNLQG